MATTDARPGFKLPWSAERTESDAPEATDATSAPEATAESPTDAAPETVTDETTPDAAPEAVAAPQPTDPWRLANQPAGAAAEPPKRKPNKLMADLTKAMQSAAESARAETLERLASDAKAYIESVHARSGTEADELRRAADEDISGIREWSKAEIARIREETEGRIADRKAGLDQEIEAHAARIEARIERVQQHVAWFEGEMAGFFERLLAEDDPTRLAAMAENLPEPPSFEDEPAELPVAPAPAATGESVAADEAPAVDATAAEAAAEAVVPANDPEAAFAAIQAAAEAADATESQDAAVAGDAQVDGPAGGFDPRLSVLGLTPEAAAEAEAEAELDGAGDVEEIESISDDALSARLAGLVPGDGGAPTSDLRSTRIVVTGLVSVASIAGFKRHLGRFEGASSVGVSSGPDGEFIFTVVHAPQLNLAAAIPGLPGFAARITETTDDTVTVAARDPETES